MKVFFNGWFGGFMDKTNPGLHYQFFIDLFQKVFQEEIEVGNFRESEILCDFDMLINSRPLHKKKNWKYKFLFSGESYLRQPKDKYDCVLWVERNHSNVINLPLFVCYLYSNNFVERLEKNVKTDIVPEKDFCAIISNSGGKVRNNFLERLEKNYKVDYLGKYKNNAPRITENYNTEEFIEKISKYKFIVSMENSREDTYITEKIIHGLLGRTIPIYWGSNRVSDYINKDRVVIYEDNDSVFEEISSLMENRELYLKKINQSVFPGGNMSRTIENVSRDIRNLLFRTKWNQISSVYTISSPVFEPERFERLQKMFHDEIGLNEEMVNFVCPTYKTTISDDDMREYVKRDLILRLRPKPMKKGEISLILNFKSVLEEIEKNHKDGIFMIFESDVRTVGNIGEIPEFLELINSKREEWDMIHFGRAAENQLFDVLNFCRHKSPYREKNQINKKVIETLGLTKKKRFSEDITSEKDKIRLLRKINTRCTDTFVMTYRGVGRLLSHFREDMNYGAPLDYYIINFLENNLDFKFYWSDKTYFLQMSNQRETQSSIQ